MSKYAVATLIGITVFDDHQAAKKELDKLSGEFKGVFSGDKGYKVEGVNVCGNAFSFKAKQLESIAQKSVQGKYIGNPIDVFMAKLKSSDGEYLYNGEYVACVPKDKVVENSPYIGVTEDMIVAQYPIMNELRWEKPDTFGTISLDSKDFNYYIHPEHLLISDLTTGTNMSIESPYTSINEGNVDNLTNRAVIELLKSSVHRAVELRQIATSLGWDTKNVTVHPINETFQFRDAEAFDVFSKVIPLSEIENYPVKNYSPDNLIPDHHNADTPSSVEVNIPPMQETDNLAAYANEADMVKKP